MTKTCGKTVGFCEDSAPVAGVPRIPGGAIMENTGRGIVGREHELAELRAGLEDAMAGHGRTFLLVGDAGIGKTILADELSDHAKRAGANVVWGRCWEGRDAPAFWPWIQVL